MKTLALLLFLPVIGFAQVDVKVNDAERAGDTTIEVKKGTKTDNKYEITQGNDEIAGDPAPILQFAQKNWKKACDEWKKEFKDLNKDNQILSMSCGTMDCKTVASGSTCKSQAKYSLKVQVK